MNIVYRRKIKKKKKKTKKNKLLFILRKVLENEIIFKAIFGN